MKQIFFDAHCDTGSQCLVKGVDIKRNSLHLDFDRMEMFDAYIQVFAAFVDKKQISCSPLEHCVSVLNYLRQHIDENKEFISMITTKEELSHVIESGKAGAILSIEGGEALCGSLENLYLYHEMGVRLITLTWNYANEIAEGVCEDHGGGLTEFGKKTVAAMEDLGIVIDVSHLSEKGFWDVVEYTRFPFVASHSNAKAICNHARNLTDKQIACMIKRRGCIGINFYPEFLSDTGLSKISDIMRHMEHILNLGGEDCLGLGSDFDGVSCLPEGVFGVESMRDIWLMLQERKISPSQMEKICFGNFYRIFMETMSRRK